ncbi:hypothetical protein OWR28_26265 [Chryseobacterium sp. 1B4]
MKKFNAQSPLGIFLIVIVPLVIILTYSGIRLDLTKEKDIHFPITPSKYWSL